MRNASLSVQTLCGFYIFLCVCGCFVRIFYVDFLSEILCADFSCGFWKMFSWQGDQEERQQSSKKPSPKSSPNPSQDVCQSALPWTQNITGADLGVLGTRCQARLLSVPLSGNIGQWLRRSSRLVLTLLRTSKLRKIMCWQNLKSQSMHIDTSLGQGVFRGWSPLPLQKFAKRFLKAKITHPADWSLERIGT